MTTRVLLGDSRLTLPTLEPCSVQAVITSPPYYGLRSYISDGDPLKPFEIGLEPSPDLYIEHMVDVFRHVRRVLRDDGVLWLNLGDSYSGSGKGPTGHNGIGNQERRQGFDSQRTDVANLPAKNLLMMPFRVAMALQQDGWVLRSVIPWLKRNSMPESVTDRPATSLEYVFLLAKSARYYWDADAVRVANAPDSAGNRRVFRGDGAYVNGNSFHNSAERANSVPGNDGLHNGRNRRNSDWFFESWQGLLLDEQNDPLALVVNPAGFSGSHFATFPPKLVEPMIKASTSERGQCPECGAPWERVTEKGELVPTGKKYDKRAYGVVVDNPDPTDQGRNRAKDGHRANMAFERIPQGWRPTCKHDAEPVPQVVLDCFFGAGTVGLVADRLGRHAIGCELKPEYAEMGAERITGDAPLFAELESA